MASENGAGTGRSAAQPEERKTETTLTTRIRINIPGSRPIPPVVVRTPVADAESNANTDEPAAGESGTTASVSALSALSSLDGPAEPAAPAPAPAAEEKANDWFAPRKPASGKGPQGGGSTNGAGMPGGSGIQTGPAAAPGAPGGARPGAPGTSGVPGSPGANGTNGANGPGGTAGTRPGAPGAPGARPTGGASPFAARTNATNGKGLPSATSAGPIAPGHGGGTGSFDVSDAVAASTGSFPVIGATDDTNERRRDDLPYFSEPGRGGPSGPTTGPVLGDGPVIPPVGPTPGLPGVPGMTGPGGPLGSGAPGAVPGQGLPGGGLSDDTAILTPQKPAPHSGPRGFGGPGENISGHTVTSGIPVVPSGPQGGPMSGPFAGNRSEGPTPHTPPKLPDPTPQTQNSTSAKPAKKKGRSKLVLLGGAVVFVAGVAYGAGLLMNHSDVPKGTTVLGVDIGGGTRDDAVQKLDSALGGRTDKPLQLSVDGKTVSLKPDQAGLQLDSKATVAAAAQSDYNPVSVIGSLFGQGRVVEPVMPVDEEKLQAALERAAGGTGSMVEGSINFESGKAVPVYGKTGTGIDAAGSTAAIEQAYRTQVETGTGTPVKVPTTTRKPTISNAEVDRMMKAFAEPAMSANVMVRADATHAVAFSPQKSLWKFITVKPVDGKLVETYDKTALQNLYGHAFDGILISRGNGKKLPVTVDDVISALRPALLGKTSAERVGTIGTNPGQS